MIGLVVIGIISGILVWNSNAMLKTYRTRQAVRDIVGLIDYTRAQALRTRRFHRIRLEAWSDNNPFSLARGQLVLQQGDDASIMRAFDPGTAIQFVADYGIGQRFSQIGITRLFLNSLPVLASNPRRMWMYFSPSGRLCVPDIAPPLTENVAVSFSTPNSCQPAFFTICLRSDLEAAINNVGEPARAIHISGSGQVEIGLGNTPATLGNPFFALCADPGP